MIVIDGSQGEGGGQVLRSSLALSILTRQPVRIDHIRALRAKPGLRPQHLKSVDAAAAVGRARVEGASLGSEFLEFAPGEIRSGRYKFDIGTAGSTSLVLQTIFLPLSLAGSSSSVIITGGTHVPHAPCFHYVERQWLYWLKQMGFDSQLSLEAAGFYPQGGGRITATIRPVRKISPLSLERRGPLRTIQGLSAVANLDPGIADRQRRQAIRRLEKRGLPARIKTEQLSSPSKGTLLFILADFEPNSTASDETTHRVNGSDTASGGRCCYYALGAPGKRAERVADEAVEAFETFLESGGAIDQYLADQLLLPLAFASGPSAYRTSLLTQHLATNAAIIHAFTQAKIEIIGEIGQPGLVRVRPDQRPGL